MFIYRGKEYEWLEDFSLKLLSQFPNAVRMTSTAPPGDDICSSPGQRILLQKASEPVRVAFFCSTVTDRNQTHRLRRIQLQVEEERQRV